LMMRFGISRSRILGIGENIFATFRVVFLKSSTHKLIPNGRHDAKLISFSFVSNWVWYVFVF
jgi:hypothetical protein